MVAWVAPAIGVAGQLLGGLFGRKSAKKDAARARANEIQDAAMMRQWAKDDEAEQYTRNRDDFLNDRSFQFVEHRAASERAGLNPLTTLGMGPVPSQMGSGGLPGQSIGSTGVPPLASLDFIQQTTGDIVDLATGQYSERQKRTQLENDLLKVQIDRIKAEAKAGLAPQLTGRIASGQSAKRTTKTEDQIVDREREVTGLHNNGDTPTDETIDDTARATARYGEGADFIYGPAVAMRDFQKALKGNLAQPRWGIPMAPSLQGKPVNLRFPTIGTVMPTKTPRPRSGRNPAYNPN